MREKVDEALTLVGLDGYARTNGARSCRAASNSALSLARAIVREPKVLLLDEPL